MSLFTMRVTLTEQQITNGADSVRNEGRRVLPSWRMTVVVRYPCKKFPEGRKVKGNIH